MASRLFTKISNRQLIVGGSVIGLGCITINSSLRQRPRELDSGFLSPADVEFSASSKYPVPANREGERFQIKNKYPHSRIDNGAGLHTESPVRWPALPAPGEQDPLPDNVPWLAKDFIDPKQPYEYCSLVKKHCWEGNINNGFRIWKNEVPVISH